MDLVSNKVDTGGKRLNLFPAKKQKKKLPVDDKVFNMMEAVADKSYVNISDMSQLKVEKSTKSIHNALMAAGMTPAYGNVADLADATLYALEGKFVGSGKFAHGVYFLQTGQYSPNQFWVSSSAEYAKAYRRNQKSGRLLEFEVPKSYYNKYFQKTSWSEDMFHGVFPKGIPTQFLKKVHK